MADSNVYRVKEPFAVPDADGYLRAYTVGALIAGNDRIASSHKHLLEPISNAVEKATAEPGTKRSLRLPSGVRLKQATEHNTGHAHKTEGEDSMVHALPPEDENSPASPFAPAQPAAGVVADDVPAEQNLANGPKASEVSAEDVGLDEPKTRARKK